MQELFDTNLIIERRDMQNLSYIFKNDDLFSQTGYKVLRNCQENGLIPCFKVNYNGKIKLVYDLTSYRPLQIILPLLKPEKFVSIILDLIDNIVNLGENGFIQINKIAFALDKIFINDKDKIAFVYIPYNESLNSFSNQIYEENVKKIIKEAIVTYKNLSVLELLRLYDDISEKKFTLENIKYYILEGRYNKQNIAFSEVEREQPILESNNGNSTINSTVSMIQPNAKLIGTGMAKTMEIIINKSEMIFGKNKDAVDILISFHPAISRVHCKIIYSNDRYYVCDLGSANGTYINGTKIKSFEAIQIGFDDEIMLANIVFILKRI
ncbi:FHA domain-containing protein [Anaeromicropila herbilytica]|uniref:FHA domain-containing protein n=1 Tax=Anaeromicropila herbilytica TaxID=2785025 RepID=A0A7R7EPF9_9FIRM|nr:FHA domain-containing protein [Anaeromicropila herbilytica]BCN32356.1 hypothetical protein bsdtb5_36510 [Anaeromicropila herbilytica]